MIIKSMTGKVLFKTIEKTTKGALERAVAQDVDLSFADLRGARLRGASLDGFRGRGACLWGADLTGADIGAADLRLCDLRCAEMGDACLADSDLSGADLRGAYFSSTMFERAVLDDVQISCPSFWNCDLHALKSFKGMMYLHKGETDIPVKSVPLVIQGLPMRLVILGDDVLWGSLLYRAGSFPIDVQQALLRTRIMVDRAFQGAILHDAINPNPKSKTGT